MNNMRIHFLMGFIMLLSGCSTVRLAIYDYQKKHDFVVENRTKKMAAAKMAINSSSKNLAAQQAFTEKACKYIGTRYKYGSCDASKGFDCSGFVYHVAKSHEINLPRSSSSMASAGTHIPWKNAEPGDLIFFGDQNRINHVGIVEKNKGNELWIIHSSSSNGVIRENILVSDYWKSRAQFAINILTPDRA